MNTMTLREALSAAIREACGLKDDLPAVQRIVQRASKDMRSAGFSVTTPVVGTFDSAFQFLRGQLETFDRLPKGDARRSAIVDREVRYENRILNPTER